MKSEVDNTLAGALFSGVQQRLLTLIFGNPDRSSICRKSFDVSIPGRAQLGAS
jgi:hypothetical protein